MVELGEDRLVDALSDAIGLSAVRLDPRMIDPPRPQGRDSYSSRLGLPRYLLPRSVSPTGSTVCSSKNRDTCCSSRSAAVIGVLGSRRSRLGSVACHGGEFRSK